MSREKPLIFRTYHRRMDNEPDNEREITEALDSVRREDRVQRDESIDEEIAQTERLSRAIGSPEHEADD